MSSVINQLFYLLQLVEPIDMNTLYNDIGQKINAYFPATPAIMNGLNYTQTGTTNIITTQKGSVRWKDQPNVLSTLPQFTWTILDPVTNLTITCPASVPQKYIVAKVTKTALNATFISVTGEILNTAYTLAEIAAFANPDEYAPLWTITNNTGVYTIGTDANCAVNYSGLYGLLAADNTWLGNNSFVQNLSKLNQNVGSIGNVTLYNDSLSIILGTLSSTNGLVFAPGEQRPLLQFNNSPLASLADVDAVGNGISAYNPLAPGLGFWFQYGNVLMLGKPYRTAFGQTATGGGVSPGAIDYIDIALGTSFNIAYQNNSVVVARSIGYPGTTPWDYEFAGGLIAPSTLRIWYKYTGSSTSFSGIIINWMVQGVAP